MWPTFVKKFHGIPPWNKMWDPCHQGPWEAEILWMWQRNQSCWLQQRLQGKERKRDTKQPKTWFTAVWRGHAWPLTSSGKLLPPLNAQREVNLLWKSTKELSSLCRSTRDGIGKAWIQKPQGVRGAQKKQAAWRQPDTWRGLLTPSNLGWPTWSGLCRTFPMWAFQGRPLGQANSRQAGKGRIWIKFP